MKTILVNENNIDVEHICCAMSDKKNDLTSTLKKEWMKERFKEGLIFRKLDIQGKVFIEYIPAEFAWCPLYNTKDYMYINCFWVSGKYAGQGYGKRLLQECIEDAKDKNKKGLLILSSKTKKPFLCESAFLIKNGFIKIDEFSFIELYYLPFSKSLNIPCFKKSIHTHIDETGYSIYYSNQCPFTEKYSSIVKEIAEQNNIPMQLHKIESIEDAQNAPTPTTTYSLFYNGEFITNEILSPTKFQKMIQK